jgi:hypothetical protein
MTQARGGRSGPPRHRYRDGGEVRLLAIVGASHKGCCEAWLNQMHDVRLVDAGNVLD